MDPLSPEDFARAANVSRETLDRFQTYLDLLVQWQKAVNLVGRETLGDPWRRHFLDSAQLLPYLPRPEGGKPLRLLDLGSGAGFPGAVLAMLAAEGKGGCPPLEVHLVDATRRKCVFLQEVARRTGTAMTVHGQRLENLKPFAVDVITARGFAPLPRLLDLAEPFLVFPETAENGGKRPDFLLLKGRQAQGELTEAGKAWKMAASTFTSVTDPAGVILRLEDVVRGQTG